MKEALANAVIKRHRKTQSENLFPYRYLQKPVNYENVFKQQMAVERKGMKGQMAKEFNLKCSIFNK